MGVNILLNNFSSLSFLYVYAPPIYSFRTDSRTDSFSHSILPSSKDLFIMGDVSCHRSCWDSKDTSDPRGEEVFNWVIFSDLLSLNNPDIPTLLYRSSSSCSSPDIFFVPSSLALSCSRRVLQDLVSDHLPILLTVPLSPISHPNERPSYDFAFYFNTYCPSAEEYSSLFLSSSAALLAFLTLNAAKSSIHFSRIKHQPKAWWSPEVEEAISERRKALLPLTQVTKIVRLTSSLPDTPCLSSSRPRLRHSRRLALPSHLNLTLNFTLFFVLSLALLPHFTPLLNFPTVPLPGSLLQSSSIT